MPWAFSDKVMPYIGFADELIASNSMSFPTVKFFLDDGDVQITANKFRCL